MTWRTVATAFLACVALMADAARADTEFTYQGHLTDGGQPADGLYDMSFSLWDSGIRGNQVGSTIDLTDVPVSEGLFTVQLDFGAAAFDNSARWLRIVVNTVALNPRQPITRAPYAIQTRGIFVDQASNVGIGTTTPQARLDVAGAATLSGPLSVNHTSPTEQLDVNGSILSRGRLLAGYPNYFFWVDPTQEFVGVGRNDQVTSSEIFGLYENTTGFSGMYIETASTGRPFYGYSAGGDIDAYHYFDGASNEWRLWHDGTRLSVGEDSNGRSLVSFLVDAFEVRSAGDLVLSAGKINETEYFSAFAETFFTSRIRWSPNQLIEIFGDIKHFGDLDVVGTLTKGSGSFRIDHPLDPENRYLSHSFVESPDMMNIYNGNVVTDENGYATVTLPDYFDALNRDFRYQLTVVDEADTDTFVLAKVVNKIQGNRFTVRTSEPNVEVSWQVTGIRDDAYAKTNPIVVEEDKAKEDRGSFLHPGAFGHSSDRAIAPRQATMQEGEWEAERLSEED